MVPALAFALLATDPAARHEAFMKAHPSFVATVEYAVGGKVVGKGTLRVARPRRLRFDFKGSGIDYAVTSTEGAYMEIDHAGGIYDERPSTGGFRMYDSRVSPAQAFVPSFLLVGSTAGVLGGDKPKATEVAGGDELMTTTQTQSGPLEQRLTIDAQGRPIRFFQKGSGGSRAWRLLSFVDASADGASFRLEPPLGYVPFALPELPEPLAIGESAPLTGWRRGGKAVDLAEPQRGKPRLLAALGADCPASRAARPTLIALGKSLPVFLIGPGEITDPSGVLLKRLSPPGTPMFYLVGGDGKVKGLWFGFDAQKSDVWQNEVRAAAR